MKRPAAMLALFAVFLSQAAHGQAGSELRFCIGAQPKTFDPLMVADDPSETVRYLTGGVLVRLNRLTQRLDPELATAWQVSGDETSIVFTLRSGVYFSDGTPFTAEDVVYTMHRLMDPALHSPVADTFRSAPGQPVVRILAHNRIAITFSSPVVGLDRLFDGVAIVSAKSPRGVSAVLGYYYIAENRPGVSILLHRNPNYWRHDEGGHPLPYIESVRLDIQQNRDTERMRLLRGEIDLINSLDPEGYDWLRAHAPQMAIDAGVSLDSEQMWFNQVASAPLPDYKKAWFASTAFRQAISASIHRDDLVRVAFRGHARPAVSWISPANKLWFNSRLAPHVFSPALALAKLGQDGFHLKGSTLYDRSGHVVEFSLVTNAGNKERELMAAMIQQDVAKIGIRLNIVTLDFPSLIERITRTFDYEACLLGLVNDDLDPDSQMNVWLSSADNHQWNPAEKAPATPWEAEIDGLMRMQASTPEFNKRKAAIDRVQQIVWEQEPFIYLVNREALAAAVPTLHNVHPVALRPQVYWNIDRLWMGGQGARGK